MSGDLFSEFEYSSVMKHREAELKKSVDTPQRELLGEDPEILAQKLAEKFEIKIPVIRRDDTEVEDRETTADARNFPSRFHFFPGENSEVPATEFLVSIPFDGDEAVFRIQGNTFVGHLPRGEISNGHIKMRYVRAPQGGPIS